jgi:hypothetical protein
MRIPVYVVRVLILLHHLDANTTLIQLNMLTLIQSQRYRQARGPCPLHVHLDLATMTLMHDERFFGANSPVRLIYLSF